MPVMWQILWQSEPCLWQLKVIFHSHTPLRYTERKHMTSIFYCLLLLGHFLTSTNESEAVAS